MTWAGVGKVTGTVLAAFAIGTVQVILRHVFGIEWMESVYETLAFMAVMLWAWFLIWGRQP